VRVFITVGTHNQGFEYLLDKTAVLTSRHQLVIQSGHSSTLVKGAFQQQSWYSPDEMSHNISEADRVISHLGCGIAREVQVLNTPTLFFCRSRQRGEHFDNHQLELKEALTSRQGLWFYEDGDDIENILNNMGSEIPQSPTNTDQLIKAIKDWLTS